MVAVRRQLNSITRDPSVPRRSKLRCFCRPATILLLLVNARGTGEPTVGVSVIFFGRRLSFLSRRFTRRFWGNDSIARFYFAMGYENRRKQKKSGIGNSSQFTLHLRYFLISFCSHLRPISCCKTRPTGIFYYDFEFNSEMHE